MKRFAQYHETGIVVAVVLLGGLIRVWNAFRYPTNWGFDARFNWEYIERLYESWSLPAPGELWASSHPPLFYYLGAVVARGLGQAGPEPAVWVIRLISSGAGLGSVALAVYLVRKIDPDRPRRALLAGGLLLFLPVHIYMSAMLNEEILAASLSSLALVGVALAMSRPKPPGFELTRAAGIGLAAGLALLTKLSGVLVALAAAAAYLLAGLRRRSVGLGLAAATVMLAITTLVGGWYYGRNYLHYGYLYPHNLPTHHVMLHMPPGERSLGDYLRIPLATWSDPQLLDPDLQVSVWGSTYDTVWFDGHRTFLPRDDPFVRWSGCVLLLLALLPTAAFGTGLWRGLGRVLRSPEGPDTPLLLLVAGTFAGYILFTARNPWFAAIKGSYLLGISIPFAYYTSEVLSDWCHEGKRGAGLIRGALAGLAILIVLVFTYGLVFTKWGEIPGLEWRT